MQVGGQHKGRALQPVHHGHSLRLPRLGDGAELIGEVAVQVNIVAIIAAQVAFNVTCGILQEKGIRHLLGKLPVYQPIRAETIQAAF